MSLWMTRCISSSRIMKLVALVSSSMSRREAPASMPSTTFAAWDVLPLASSVQKPTVSFPLGKVIDEHGDIRLLNTPPVLGPDLHGPCRP